LEDKKPSDEGMGNQEMTTSGYREIKRSENGKKEIRCGREGDEEIENQEVRASGYRESRRSEDGEKRR